MRILKIQEQLKQYKKDYCTTSDLKRILKQKGGSLRVSLHRLTKQNVLIHIRRGIYMIPEQIHRLDRVIGQVYYPTYLSFETALARHGIINQIPYTMTFASYTQSKRFFIGEFTVEIRRIQRSLFWGYVLQDDLLIANPEKALLDQLYLVSLGKAYLDFDELNLHELSKTKFLKWAKKFPKATQKLAKKLVEHFGEISITGD